MSRKRPLLAVAVLVVPLALAGAPAMAGGEVNFILGQKYLDLDAPPEFSDLEDQTEYGALFSWNGDDWPVSLAIDILRSSGDVSGSYYGYEYKYEAETTELAFGVRKFFGENTTQGYVGGGPAWINGDLKITLTNFPGSPSVSDDDSAFGYWLNAGVVWRLGESLNLGIDARYSDAEVTVDPFGDEPEKFKAGGTHIGAYVGFRWGP